MYKISKQFELCYTHRVWKQELSDELSNNSICKCKRCHGHNSIITVELEGEMVNPQGMLLDYVNLNWFKKFIDDQLDHKTILDLEDPWAIDFVNSTRTNLDKVSALDLNAVQAVVVNDHVEYCIAPTPSTAPHHIEVAGGLVLVQFVPTSENLCKWLYGMVERKLGGICKVSSVSFSETLKTLATYLK